MIVTEIKERLLGSIPESVFGSSAVIDKMIKSATQTVFTYIDRDLEIKEYTQYMELEDWEPFGDKFKFIPAITPVTESDITYGKNFFLSDEPLEQITYKAGFESVPEDIANVIYTLTVFEINRSLGNTYNLSTKTVVTGSTTANISKAPEDFYADELKRLDKYKSKSHYANVIIEE